MLRIFATFACVTLSLGTAAADSRACRRSRMPLLKVGVYADAGASGIGATEWFRIVHESPEMELKLLDGQAPHTARDIRRLHRQRH